MTDKLKDLLPGTTYRLKLNGEWMELTQYVKIGNDSILEVTSVDEEEKRINCGGRDCCVVAKFPPGYSNPIDNELSMFVADGDLEVGETGSTILGLGPATAIKNLEPGELFRCVGVEGVWMTAGKMDWELDFWVVSVSVRRNMDTGEWSYITIPHDLEVLSFDPRSMVYPIGIKLSLTTSEPDRVLHRKE